MLIALLDCIQMSLFGCQSNKLILLEPKIGYHLVHLLQVHHLAPMLDRLGAWRPLLEWSSPLPLSYKRGVRGELKCYINLQGELLLQNHFCMCVKC